MKSYIIWLQGGNCIRGKVLDDVATQLLKTYTKPLKKPLYTFVDTEGIVIVDFRKVSAIGLNDTKDRW